MKKQIFSTILLIMVVISFAACSSIKLPFLSQGTAQPTQVVLTGEFSKMTPEARLALGILKLEGTSYAVTAAQAKALLPLWKADRSLRSLSTTAPEELQALYQQVQESMSAEQLQEIEKTSVTIEDLTAIMRSAAAQQQPSDFGQGSTSATRTSNRGQQGFPRGDQGIQGVPGGVVINPGGAGGIPGGAAGVAGQGNVQTTRAPGQASTAGSNQVGITTLLTLLITLLQTRAGA